MGEHYRALTCEQQGHIMSCINELALIDDDNAAEEYAQSIRDFVDMLVWFKFISPQMRTKYAGGIRDTLEIRRKRRAMRA